MTQYEMAQNLARKCEVTLEEAMAALEAGSWNALTATHILEQENFRRKQALDAIASENAESGPEAQPEAEAAGPVRAEAKKARRNGLKQICRAIRDLVALGNRSRFAIHRDGSQLLEMPVTVLAVLLLFSFGTCALLLVAGLLAGCRYSVNGNVIGAGA